MANVADTYMIYQVLKRLTTPFNETKAFELGLIDKDGKLLKKPKTTDEKSKIVPTPVHFGSQL